MTFLSTLIAVGPEAPKFTVNKPDSFLITDIGVAFTSLLNLAFLVAGLIVFAYLVMGGIQWITSGGDKAKTEAARGRITAALVGLAIVAASYALMKVIGYVFGIDVTSLSGSSIPKLYGN